MEPKEHIIDAAIRAIKDDVPPWSVPKLDDPIHVVIDHPTSRPDLDPSILGPVGKLITAFGATDEELATRRAEVVVFPTEGAAVSSLRDTAGHHFGAKELRDPFLLVRIPFSVAIRKIRDQLGDFAVAGRCQRCHEQRAVVTQPSVVPASIRVCRNCGTFWTPCPLCGFLAPSEHLPVNGTFPLCGGCLSWTDGNDLRGIQKTGGLLALQAERLKHLVRGLGFLERFPDCYVILREILAEATSWREPLAVIRSGIRHQLRALQIIADELDELIEWEGDSPDA